MKKKSNSLGLLLLFLSITIHSQETNLYKITPEISKKIIEENNLDLIIVKVNFKEVDFPIYEVGEVPSVKYQEEVGQLEEYLKTYQDERDIVEKKNEEIKSIVLKIDEFLNSKESYDSKKYLLIEAQKIVSKYKLATEYKSENINMPNVKIYLYNDGEQTSKKDLKIYKTYIQNISFADPEQFQSFKEYTRQLERLNSTNKTEKGLVLLNKTLKKEIYIVEDTLLVNYEKIDGLFSILENKFSVVLTDIPNKFIKNQIANENEFNYNTSLFSSSYNLIKNNDSDEYYFIMDDKYLSILSKSQEEQKLLDIVHKLGYKEYKFDGDTYINSKTCEIRLCSDVYIAFTKNPSWLTELDNKHLKLAALAKQTIPHSKTLNKYVMQWNIQRSNMPTASINSWRTAASPAIKLSEQIYKLLLDDEPIYYFAHSLDKSDTLEYFLDNVLASRGVLGM